MRHRARRTGLWLIMLGGLWLAYTSCAGPQPQGLAPHASALVVHPDKTLAVIGVSPRGYRIRCGASQPVDKHVGFGLNTMLEGLLAEHGGFRVLETMQLGTHQQLLHLIERYWVEPQVTYAKTELHGIAALLGTTWLAFGHIIDSRLYGSTTHFGPFSRMVEKLRVTIEVCLYERPPDTLMCRRSTHTTQQEAQGLVGEAVFHCLDLIENNAGKSMYRAMNHAVQRLVQSAGVVP